MRDGRTCPEHDLRMLLARPVDDPDGWAWWCPAGHADAAEIDVLPTA